MSDRSSLTPNFSDAFGQEGECPAPLESTPNGSDSGASPPSRSDPPAKQPDSKTVSPPKQSPSRGAGGKASLPHKNPGPAGGPKPVLPLEIPAPPLAAEHIPSTGTPDRGGSLVVERVRPWWAPMGRKESTGFLTSFFLHLVLIVGLAWIFSPPGVRGQPSGQWLGSLAEADSLADLLTAGAVWTPAGKGEIPAAEAEPVQPDVPVGLEVQPPWPKGTASVLPQPPVSAPSLPVPFQQDMTLPVVRFVPGGGLEARNPQTRTQWAVQRGATQASEDAVERGLRWLLAHQLRNGGWNFDHRQGNCPGLCRNPGSHASTTAATSLALLAFLGAGYTHREGPYQGAVHQGFYYLLSRGVKAARGLDFMEGTMYGHGLATIALSEAYAMTGDPMLKQYAQQAIDFIVYAQDKQGGGWRYLPGQPGDTTVTGWQLMALRSGQMAGLNVPSPTIILAWKFLDSVQGEQGAVYGYMDPAPRHSTTAIGLLCRMYLGWRPEHGPLRQGIAHVDQWGPSPEDIYYNYYATQLMHHWQATEWKRWNARMRDYLVRTQATQGHEAGSWYFDGEHTRPGGRLFSTAAAIMTLEVYYRYMPLYETKAVQGRL